MWVRGAAIRPVPPYAVVDGAVLDALEVELGGDSEHTRSTLDSAFARFEQTQPHVAERLGTLLGRPIDDTALALGYFLSIAIWLAFERSFGARLTQVTEAEVEATEAALRLEDDLRARHGEQPLDLEDVVAIEQPGIVSFIHGHVEAALEPHPEEGDRREVDVDDVYAVYRTMLVVSLALSHAVLPAHGARPPELLA